MYNVKFPEVEWIALNFQQLLTPRQLKFSIIKTNNFKVGNNILANRLHILSNKINLTDLNEPISSFKKTHQKHFLSKWEKLHINSMRSFVYFTKAARCGYEIHNMIQENTILIDFI